MGLSARVGRVLGARLFATALVLLQSAAAGAQEQPPQPVLASVRLDGVTVFSRYEVLRLLNLREGAPLPDAPAAVAERLQGEYARGGYTEARVSGTFSEGRLTLTADEGRIDDIEFSGVPEQDRGRLREQLGIGVGDIYNSRTVGSAIRRFLTATQGAFSINHGPKDVVLERRGGRNVLIVPLHRRGSRLSPEIGSGREDLFSPVDGLSLGLGFTSTIFDHQQFNHAFIAGYVSYKFARGEPGYSFGGERPLFGSTKLFLGGEIHDITTSDDLWRLTSGEQTLVSIAFKNTFREYYRRKGEQVFAVLRPRDNNELFVMARWDRDQPLANATNFSLFRDDATYRANPAVADSHVNGIVFGYTFDTRGLTAAGQKGTYERHLKDSFFGFGDRQRPGMRIEWTSEIAGRALGGDAQFDRHILNTRGYLPLGPHTQLSARGLVGFSDGTLPIERLFAVGGIGSVRGYRFKEATGTGMVLINAEYRVFLTPPIHDGDALNVFAFYDAGKVTGALPPSPAHWLNGVGFGAGFGMLRLECAFRASDVPHSPRFLVRLSPTF
jgi:outer membrane protein assembly factor BamA